MKMMYLILSKGLSACSLIITKGQPGAVHNSLEVNVYKRGNASYYLLMGEWQAELINMYLLDPKMSQHFIVWNNVFLAACKT